MYDGVRTHGIIHEIRMQNVFWRRQRIPLKMLEVLIAALPPPSSNERAALIAKSWREMIELIYPDHSQEREDREKYLATLLQRQQGTLEIVPTQEGRDGY